MLLGCVGIFSYKFTSNLSAESQFAVNFFLDSLLSHQQIVNRVVRSVPAVISHQLLLYCFHGGDRIARGWRGLFSHSISCFLT